MNKTQRKTINLRRKVRRNLTSRVVEAKALPTWDSQVEAGSVWYVDEQAFCLGLAKEYGYTLQLVTTWYAWTSIRQRLAQNKVLTVQACRNDGLVDALPIVTDGCHAAYKCWLDCTDPTATLTGRKTHNFALALQGDPEAVVVDVWMMRAAGFDTDAPTKLQYDAIEHVIRSMARDMGLEPRTLQALLWIIVRGGAA